jgi:prepilin-type N-terminal cleavage/methylation domain-containing protein
MPRRPISTTAFSLIELLVVIAIVAVITAMLLPSLKSARDVAKRSVCASNMKQHGIMLGMYAADIKDWIPQPGSRHFWIQGGGKALGGTSFVHLRTGSGQGPSCPEGIQGGWNRVTPTAWGWFFWLGYATPMGNRSINRGIWECPDVAPGFGATAIEISISESAWRDRQYNNNFVYTTQLAKRDMFPTTSVNPEGAGWDCQSNGGGNYYHRGWYGGNRVSKIKSNTTVAVDGERQLSFRYSDPHGDGINLLFNHGGVKFAAKDISGQKPHVYFSMVSEGRTLSEALTANGPSSGWAYAGNAALTNLWAYYDAQ